MTKIAIIHYQPLEYYPPVTNLLDTLAGLPSDQFESIYVFSCKNVKGRSEYKSSSTSNTGKRINIKRSPFPRESNNSLLRVFKYIHFNLFTLVGLLLQRPASLLYYESYSSWPAYIYSRYFNRQCHIFIHNHEYADRKWYATTMRQVRYFHMLEKKWLYPRAVWNSQTNSERLQFFHNDHPTLMPETLKTLPNYPPSSWKSQFLIKNTNSKKIMNLPYTILKVVYVGSLSFQSTFLREFCNWVIEQRGKVQFDIYAYNLYNEVKEYLSTINCPNISYIEKGVEYNNMPHLLSKYHVGLILYKAHNQNYTYNAPNKLFEYLSCDLDVWYHQDLQGPQPYNTNNTFPQIIPIDFENLSQFDWISAYDKKEKAYKPLDYYCEKVYAKLIKEITSA